MSREEAIEELKILKEDYWDDDGYGHETKQYDDTMLALDMAIKALEKEPKNNLTVDAVSKKAVLEIYDEWFATCNIADKKESPKAKINALPQVTTSIRPKGHWLPQNDDYCDWYECSECGYGSEGEMQCNSEHDVRTNYCPYCGADMRGEEE